MLIRLVDHLKPRGLESLSQNLLNLALEAARWRIFGVTHIRHSLQAVRGMPLEADASASLFSSSWQTIQ
jgi:hypothetical protein